MRQAGIVSGQSAANATAFHRVELNPNSRTIQITEFGVSMNGAPNSTLAAVDFTIERSSTVGTGSAGTVVQLLSDVSTALTTTALINNTADGTLVETLHRFYVPVISGIIWVAAPGREFDCIGAEFVSIKNQGSLGASITAESYMVFEE